MLKYGVCLCKGSNGCCVFCLNLRRVELEVLVYRKYELFFFVMQDVVCFCLVCIMWQFSIHYSA